MNSKDKFLDVATRLFSQFGYSGVSVRDIAKELGMRESAMYKHFASKADIMNSIILQAKEKLETFQQSINVVGKSIKDIVIDMQEKLLNFYTLDIFMNQFRKIMIISQYENMQSKLRYDEMFINKTLDYYEEIFSRLAEEKSVKISARLMAYELYSPLFLLMQQNDCENSVEKLKVSNDLLRQNVEAFFSRYSFLEVMG